LQLNKIPILIFISLSLFSCSDWKKGVEPDRINDAAFKQLGEFLKSVDTSGGIMDDSTFLGSSTWVKAYYKQAGANLIWSEMAKSHSKADTLIGFLSNAAYYGLIPNVYHLGQLSEIKKQIAADSAGTGARRDPSTWAKYDLLLTDAFLTIARHLHEGQLPPDTIYNKLVKSKDSVYYYKFLNTAVSNVSMRSTFEKLEPSSEDYVFLKHALRSFLDSADFSRNYTYLIYPYKDSAQFIKTLITRLKEGGWLNDEIKYADSALLAQTILKVQAENHLGRDGKPGRKLVDFLNKTDPEIFRKVAINLDRHRQLQHILPDHYIGVNLPGFYLFVREQNRNRLCSKVVVGRPYTRTPLLSSVLSDIVTYPQWTIPRSIIANEILPKLRRDPGALSRMGYMLLGNDGNIIDPYSVNWSKYSGSIPYRVVQGSGDNNALGVLKFNFQNPYSVYLHDTNQRHLFNNEYRSLSHGCVRVQEWEKLAYYILAKDSVNHRYNGGGYVRSDSLRTWLNRKENHVIPLKSRMPLFLFYFTAEGKGGTLVLHEDIYREDEIHREGYLPVFVKK